MPIAVHRDLGRGVAESGLDNLGVFAFCDEPCSVGVTHDRAHRRAGHAVSGSESSTDRTVTLTAKDGFAKAVAIRAGAEAGGRWIPQSSERGKNQRNLVTKRDSMVMYWW